MKKFLSEDFLLQGKAAKVLYHDYASSLPIIDYHSHLPPKDVASDRKFENISRIWLEGDHYKWRAMRILGIDEKYVTGNGSDIGKFRKWAYTLPYTVRNPLYHWSHLELKNYFGIDELLTPDNADRLYAHCNNKLAEPEFSAKGLLKQSNVEVVCTTDDPADSLEHHKTIRTQNLDTRVLPTFRPDEAYSFSDPKTYNNYLDRLEKVSGVTIRTLDNLLEALEKRVGFFHEMGCRLADHGLEKLGATPSGKPDLDTFFKTVRNGSHISDSQAQGLQLHILHHLGHMYHKRSWVQQFHLGALRNANTRMYNHLGAASGFDSISDAPQSRGLATHLDSLDKTDQLPKTILYNLNPTHNAIMATMAGNFNDGSERGKVQYGTAWWFLDQKDGMEEQMKVLSNMGLLSCFIGMLTDSRSFLSYPRHEYFRRILCNLVGSDVEKGELPDDIEWLGKIVSDICYHNARGYFDF